VSPLISLLLDGLIVTLLVAFIVFAVRLNRSLAGLREGKAELERLIREFGEATARAETGVKGLKRTADETGAGLQARIDKAKALQDELAIIVESGERLADRLASAASRPAPAAPRPEPRPEPRLEPRPEPRPARPELRVAAESPLAAQMRAAEAGRRELPRAAEPRRAEPREEPRRPEARPAAAPAAPAGAPRSKAERELLEAIENMR